MTLLLDPDIRDWVVMPLFVIMIAAGLLRTYVGQWLQGDKVKVPVVAARSQNVLRQTTRLRSYGASHCMTTTWKWHLRKQTAVQKLRDEADWCEAEQAKQEEKGDDSDDPMGGMMNPMGMLQGNMAFMVQNMVMMQGIQHFFSGFILLKIPFALTAGFKSMFQRGVASLPDLEPSYVSSISWYFLVMYGLRGFLKLLIGDPSVEMREQDLRLAAQGYQNPPQPGKKQDGETMAKQLRQEAENAELYLPQNHKSEFDTVERRLLKSRYPKKSKAVTSESDFLLGGGSKRQKGNKKTQ